MKAERYGGLWAAAFLVALAGVTPLASAASPCSAGAVMVGATCTPQATVVAEIDRIVRAAMEAKHVKATLAGVAIDGVTVMNKAWGESMTGVPATPDMHFRNGAVAIAYIGIVLLQAAEKGIVGLDDKLSKYFPEYPKADQITLAMLMHGTSGYADFVNMDILPLYKNPFRVWTPDELIALGLGQKMVCDPGNCWSYAHTNFVIVGKVLEKATGKPMEALIKEGILDPLRLRDTRSEQTAVIQEPVLHAFDAERGTYEESTYWDPSWTLAKGAIMTSNIADILTSAAAIGEGKLVSADSFKLQFAPVTATFKPWSGKMYYGLGVFLINGWAVQNPSFAGYAATMAYLPSRKLAIAVSSTMKPEASLEGNLSTDILTAIAAYLAPEATLKQGKQ
ncbi:MAG: serine hydrolase domain-containing protein [Bauldia sp.]